MLKKKTRGSFSDSYLQVLLSFIAYKLLNVAEYFLYLAWFGEPFGVSVQLIPKFSFSNVFLGYCKLFHLLISVNSSSRGQKFMDRVSI